MKKILVTILAAMTMTIACQAAFAADVKVGCVDTGRVLSSYSAYSSAQRQLAQLAQRKETTAREAYEKEKDEKKKAQIIQKMQKEMAQEEEKLLKPVLKTVNNTVERVAKQKGVTVVVNKSIVYYGGTDITSDVIAALKR